jgi:hypothetical protein
LLLSAHVRNSLPSFSASHRTFQSADDDDIFRLAVVGPAKISGRREALIGWAKRFECAVDFEFLPIESDDSLPAQTDAVFLCGPAQFLDWRGVTVWIRSGVDADVAVCLSLAVAISQAKGSDDFEFLD